MDDPLLAKGVVFSDGKSRYVMCAVDWCLLQTGAYDLMRQRIARARDIPESHVAVQTVHQHNAPIADVNAQLLSGPGRRLPAALDLKFMEEVAARIGEAVRGRRPALASGHSHRLRQGPGGAFRLQPPRAVGRRQDSRPLFGTTDPALQDAPEGLVDPWLRTVTFFAGDQPLVRLHYYASHPQSYYGDGRATSDTAGLARRRLESEEGVPQVYFTGCAGNITAGKYNDGSPRARGEFAERLYTAMKEAISKRDARGWRS